MQRITFRGIELVGDVTGSDARDRFVLTEGGVTGWDAAVGTRVTKTERPWGHGSFPATALYGDRVVAASGVVNATSPRILTHLLDQLAAIPLGYDWLQVMDHNRTLRARAQLESVTADRFKGTMSSAKFQVTWWCPEPWKYGHRHQYTAALGRATQVFHRGTTDAGMQLTVTGPVTSTQLRFRVGGRALTFLGGIASSQTITIDTRALTAHDRSGRLLAARLFGEPLTVPPGRVSNLEVSGAGSGRVTVDIADTYL